MHDLVRLAFQGLANIRGTSESRSGVRSHKIASDAIRKSDLPWQHIKPFLWATQTTIRHGFVVQTELLAHEWFVVCVASAGITIEPEWFPRGLGVALLEQNQRLKYGSFRLEKSDAGLSVVLGNLCDSKEFDAAHVASIATALHTQMQETVIELYARDLIVVPHCRSATA